MLERLELVARLRGARCERATLPSSARWRTTFTSSLRRSSVSGGNGEPDHGAVVGGVDAEIGRWIAFSIALIAPLS